MYPSLSYIIFLNARVSDWICFCSMFKEYFIMGTHIRLNTFIKINEATVFPFPFHPIYIYTYCLIFGMWFFSVYCAILWLFPFIRFRIFFNWFMSRWKGKCCLKCCFNIAEVAGVFIFFFLFIVGCCV